MKVSRASEFDNRAFPVNLKKGSGLSSATDGTDGERLGIPRSSEARLFYRCALQRYEEAEVLLEAAYTTGAVYLAGYGVECMLKALVLMAVPAGDRHDTLMSFRGGKAHEYEWLRSLYLTTSGARFPRDIAQHFTFVNDCWSTDLRYTPRSVRAEEAAAFLASSQAIIRWADGRL